MPRGTLAAGRRGAFTGRHDNRCSSAIWSAVCLTRSRSSAGSTTSASAPRASISAADELRELTGSHASTHPGSSVGGALALSPHAQARGSPAEGDEPPTVRGQANARSLAGPARPGLAGSRAGRPADRRWIRRAARSRRGCRGLRRPGSQRRSVPRCRAGPCAATPPARRPVAPSSSGLGPAAGPAARQAVRHARREV